MFLPTTRQEMLDREWEQLDVILVTGDTYIDSPFRQELMARGENGVRSRE